LRSALASSTASFKAGEQAEETRLDVRRRTGIVNRSCKFNLPGSLMVCSGPNFARCIEAPGVSAAFAGKTDCAE